MTPKEKAQEIIDKYLPEVRGADRYNYNIEDTNFFIAKKCSLIAVDEILKIIDDYNNSELCHDTLLQVSNDRFYWTEVKQEIEIL